MSAGHLFEVGTRAEISTRTRQDKGANIWIRISLDKGIEHPDKHLAIDCILTLWPVQSDDQQMALAFSENRSLLVSGGV
jgi:hypothetical protein